MPVGALRIPFIGGLSERERYELGERIERKFRPFSVIKPLRVLGAVWTSDKVAQRRAVVMCELCWRRYTGWWRKAEYRADWSWPYIGDCDGCSTHGCRCTLFYPAEDFYTVLSPAHGRNPQP
jgi:hypothetical protein